MSFILRNEKEKVRLGPKSPGPRSWNDVVVGVWKPFLTLFIVTIGPHHKGFLENINTKDKFRYVTIFNHLGTSITDSTFWENYNYISFENN